MKITKVQETAVNTIVETKKRPRKTGRLSDWTNNPNRITIVINDIKAVLK